VYADKKEMLVAGKARSDMSDLLDAPRIQPESSSAFFKADVAQLEKYGFRKDNSFKKIPDSDLSKARQALKDVHTTPDVLPTPRMNLPYYLAHHVFFRMYSERECEYMIRKLAAAARAKRHMHVTTQALLNEVEERNGDMPVAYEDDVDLEGDSAVFMAACEQWATDLTAEEAQALEHLTADL
jgi:hypothetical protein